VSHGAKTEKRGGMFEGELLFVFRTVLGTQ
jgi:hypothetical protein